MAGILQLTCHGQGVADFSGISAQVRITSFCCHLESTSGCTLYPSILSTLMNNRGKINQGGGFYQNDVKSGVNFI